jgi:phosphatidate cytidylyltransferase
MLKRSVTALLAGALFMVLCLQGFWWAVAAMLIVNSFCLLEYMQFLQQRHWLAKAAVLLLHHLLLIITALGLSHLSSAALPLLLIFLLAGIYSAQALADFRAGREDNAPWLLLRSAILISVPLGIAASIASWPGGFPFLILLMGASWGADTGAIWTGKLIGQTTLSRRISPKKTVEGVIGGALSAGACWLVAAMVFGTDIEVLGCALDGLPTRLALAILFSVGMLLSIAGVLGDLTFSLFKRQQGLKDYGGVLPGHGGFLDRFDSFIFVAPLLYLLLLAV